MADAASDSKRGAGGAICSKARTMMFATSSLSGSGRPLGLGKNPLQTGPRDEPRRVRRHAGVRAGAQISSTQRPLRVEQTVQEVDWN